MHTKRINSVLSLIDLKSSVLDLGTDHGYLPIAIKKRNPQQVVGASDINSRPLQSARKNFKKHDLNDIRTYLSDGLTKITDPYQIIVLSGLGTHTIISILEKDPEYLTQVEQLILGANREIPELRKWLREHYFQIVAETIVSDYKYYEFIKAIPVKEKAEYTEADFLFGPCLRHNQNETFIEKWLGQYQKNKLILAKLKNHPDRQSEIEKEQELIRKEIGIKPEI